MPDVQGDVSLSALPDRLLSPLRRQRAEGRVTERRYVYLGDRLTDPKLVGSRCVAVTRVDGRCICGRSSMLVVFAGEAAPRVVLRRRLRRTP